MRSIGTQFMDKKRLLAFLNDSLLKKSWTINQLEQKPAMQMMGLLTGHCHFKGHPLVNSITDTNRYSASNTLTRSSVLRAFDHIKIQAPGSIFYETR